MTTQIEDIMTVTSSVSQTLVVDAREVGDPNDDAPFSENIWESDSGEKLIRLVVAGILYDRLNLGFG